MDEKKENETQAVLESSADAAPDSDDQETDQGSESIDDTGKAPEKEISNRTPGSSNAAIEEGSESEITEETETGPGFSEFGATDQQADDGAGDAEVSEGQTGGKNIVPWSDEAPDGGDSATATDADPSIGDHEIADGEAKETDSFAASSEEKQQDTVAESAGKDQPEQQSDDAEAQTEALSDSKAKVKFKKKVPLAKIALTVIILAAVFSGFFIFDNKSNIKSAQKRPSKKAENAVVSKAGYEKTKPAIQPDDPNYIFNAKIKEISVLRETLLRKKEEIRQLQNYYREGIEELEKEIFDEMRSANAGTLLQALENKSIEFKLRTIQRRHAYMRQLDRPSDWINRACEDLLYLKRRAMVDLQVAEVASGIDMNMHMRHMNTAIEKYRPTADRLAVDMTNARLEPLENIWEQIQTRKFQTSNNHASSRNGVISEQVCRGVFSEVTELSEISVETAKCIAGMPGSDLFLNELSEISPRAAKYLFQWKGSWLCLNGLKALSPRVANHLFQWDGGWISLNGLTEFPAEIGQLLLQWPGKQLELMGLRYTDHSFDNIGIEYLVRWERSGGKLFVPREVREKMDELKRNSA